MREMTVPGAGLHALCTARIEEGSDRNNNMFAQPKSEK